MVTELNLVDKGVDSISNLAIEGSSFTSLTMAGDRA